MQRRMFAMLAAWLAVAGTGHGQAPEVTSADLVSFGALLGERYPTLDAAAVLSTGAATPVSAATAATAAPAAPPRTVAIFARDRTANPRHDEMVGGLRDLVGAHLAARDVRVQDWADAVAAFDTGAGGVAARDVLVNEAYGGSATRLGEQLGVSHVLLVALNHLGHTTLAAAGGPLTTYRATFSVKLLDAASGAAVHGAVLEQRVPVPGGPGDPAGPLQTMLGRVAEKIAEDAAAAWRKLPAPADVARVGFTVRTTIDTLVDGLENGTRAPNELLDEFRRAVGGVTVELDGVAIGSAPGPFRASPGLHRLRVTRQWMEPWEKTVRIEEGADFFIALELSEAGVRKFGALEAFRASAAVAYAEAAYRKGIKINFDNSAWRDVAVGAGVNVKVHTGDAGEQE